MLKMIFVKSQVKEVLVALETELAWAAGFIDGEGSTTTRKTKHNTYQLSLQIQQKGSEPLDKIKEILGGEVYASKVRPGIFKWSIQKKESVINCLNQLWPYLTEVKKRQAIIAVEKG